jgi:predicted DNA-binding ribbon-helix-helix protein
MLEFAAGRSDPGRRAMKSLVMKRSVIVGGHKTSVSLEEAFWSALKEIAAKRGASLSQVVATIDTKRELGNLSSAIRLFVLNFYLDQIAEQKR